MNSKRGAVELSIGTIVIIVLAMSMLILGIVLVKNIFGGAMDITDMTNEQLKSQVSKMFGEDKPFVMYPDSRQLEMKIGEVSSFGFGIKNLGKAGSDTKFSYEVTADDIPRKCEVRGEAILRDWVVTGGQSSGIPIAIGEISIGKVTMEIPGGVVPCTFRLRVNVKENSANYATDFIDITLKP